MKRKCKIISLLIAICTFSLSSAYGKTYKYDEQGRLVDDNAFKYSYDDEGRVIKRDYIGGGYWEHTYDGNTVTENWVGSYVSTYVKTYDDRGNLLSSKYTYSGGTYTVNYTYTIDENGNLVRKSDGGNGHASYETIVTDSNGNILSEVNTWGSNIILSDTYEYEYDEYNNIIKSIITHKDGSTTVNTYIWADPDWKSNQDSSQKSGIKRIYTVEEATEALGKNNKNNFSIRYR